MYGLKYLALLAANGLASIGRYMPAIQAGGPPRAVYNVPGGKVYVSRSKYTPGGPHRNCGDRGISPKSVLRRQRHASAS